MSDCIEFDNLIIALFKTKWQYYFPNVSRVQLGGIFSAYVRTEWDLKISLALLDPVLFCLTLASESKAEMCAAIWKLPTDFDDMASSEDRSTHQSLEHVCRLEPGDCGEMKRFASLFYCSTILHRWLCFSVWVPDTFFHLRIMKCFIVLHETLVIRSVFLSFSCFQRFLFYGQINPYKPGVLFVGHMQTVQNQIRRRKTRHLIRFSTVGLQKCLLKFE